MKVTFTIDLPKESASVMAAYMRKKAHHFKPIIVDFEDGTQHTLDGHGFWSDTTPKPVEPEPAKDGANSRTRRRAGEKRCYICEQWKPIADFPQGNTTGGGMAYMCYGCYSLYLSERRRLRELGESTKGLVAILRAQLAEAREIAP